MASLFLTAWPRFSGKRGNQAACAREIEAAFNINSSDKMMDSIEQMLAKR
ncbi:MAG: hypothetical protein WBB23_02145 [Desulforhopalus sp.]